MFISEPEDKGAHMEPNQNITIKGGYTKTEGPEKGGMQGSTEKEWDS